MKKFNLFLVAVLVMLGMTVNAQAWFVANPRDTAGGANVQIPVYNNSGSALDEGDVVVWDLGSSTGDDDLYVTTTTTADTGLVAGVISASGCAASSDCSLIVYGLAQCDIGSTGTAAGGLICTASTAVGDGDSCNNDAYHYAIAGIAGTSTQIECFVK